MTPEQLNEITQREAYCKPFGEVVMLSRAERDALVHIVRLVMEKFSSGNGIPVERITIRAEEL